MLWGIEIDCVSDVCRLGVNVVYCVAAVVLKGRAHIPAVVAVWGPCASLRRGIVGNDFDAWWCQGGGGVVVAAVEIFVCREQRVDSSATEEVECEFSLG